MEHHVTVEITAPPETVWAVWDDVERWPDWNDAVDEAEWVNRTASGGRLVVGQRARLKQPRLLAGVWRVTDAKPDSSFTWETRVPGVITRATHEITATGEEACQVRLGVSQTGLLAWLVGLLFGRLTRRYVGMEAEGLKQRAETISRP